MTNSLMSPIDENTINYDEDKKIDLHNLHNNWLEIANKIGKYNKLLTQAEKERDQIKFLVDIEKGRLDVVKAKFDLAIRKNPKNYHYLKSQVIQHINTLHYLSISIFLSSIHLGYGDVLKYEKQ